MTKIFFSLSISPLRILKMASDEKPPSNAKPPLFKRVTLSAPMLPVEIISDIIIPDMIPNII